jgi:hypothetical protein
MNGVVKQPDRMEREPHSDGDTDSQSGKISTGENDGLIGFEEAARILGIGERNLRKIIQRSRERIEGRWTSGPIIRFFQFQPKAAIKFRREWLEDFINEYTHDPNSPSLLPPDPPRRTTKQRETVGFGSQGGSTEPVHGFDSSLYDL